MSIFNIVVYSFVAILAGISDIFSRLLKPKKVESFWDVVRNPELMPNVDRYHQEIEAEAEALSGNGDAVAALVDDYVFRGTGDQHTSFEIKVLRKLGEQGYCRALEILRDPGLKSQLSVGGSRTDVIRSQPISRICHVLSVQQNPPGESIPLLMSFLEVEDNPIKMGVAGIIGLVANRETLPAFQKVLRDSGGYVAGAALMGLTQALHQDRVAPTMRGPFFEAIASLWPDHESRSVNRHLPEALLMLDQQRAVTFFVRPNIFNKDFPGLCSILRSLRERGVTVDRERLLEIVQSLEDVDLDRNGISVLGETLTLLGTYRNENDLKILEKYLEHKDDRIVECAIEGWYAHCQFHQRFRDPEVILKNKGWTALTVPERHLLAVKFLDLEIRNGGFAQYYFNSYGDNWKDALEGLLVIGATARHAIMMRTVQKFGTVGPSQNRSTRGKQLANIANREVDPFELEDRAWYADCLPNLTVLLFEYNRRECEGREKSEADEIFIQPADRSIASVGEQNLNESSAGFDHSARWQRANSRLQRRGMVLFLIVAVVLAAIEVGNFSMTLLRSPSAIGSQTWFIIPFVVLICLGILWQTGERWTRQILGIGLLLRGAILLVTLRQLANVLLMSPDRDSLAITMDVIGPAILIAGLESFGFVASGLLLLFSKSVVAFLESRRESYRV